MGVPLRVAMFSVPLSLQPPHYASLRSASLRWPLRALHSAHAVLPQKQGLQGLSLFFCPCFSNADFSGECIKIGTDLD